MKLTYPLAPPSRTISVFSLNVLCKNFLLARSCKSVCSQWDFFKHCVEPPFWLPSSDVGLPIDTADT